jgi:hypothetical protein
MEDKFKWKRNTNWFDKNPDNINKKGRAPQWVKALNKILEEKGYEPVTKHQVEYMVMNLLNLKESEVASLAESDESAMFAKIVLREMLWNNAFNAINSMLDRGIGKPVQKVDWEQKVDLVVSEAQIKEMSADEVSAYIKSKLQ